MCTSQQHKERAHQHAHLPKTPTYNLDLYFTQIELKVTTRQANSLPSQPAANILLPRLLSICTERHLKLK